MSHLARRRPRLMGKGVAGVSRAGSHGLSFFFFFHFGIDDASRG
jgi:hypothetical protein